jgi:hypothetical protein
MHFPKSFNKASVFCFCVAVAILAAALLGYAVNHTLEWSAVAGLLIIEGILIEEATLDGLMGVGCFYLISGFISLFTEQRKSERVTKDETASPTR